MSDRGMIKWLPFDSLTSSKEMVSRILERKNYKTKPAMSEEQMLEIQEKLWEGYHNQMNLNIWYYYRGQYLLKEHLTILSIQVNQKRIVLEDHSILYFDQILKII